jgi:hypothetical protein
MKDLAVRIVFAIRTIPPSLNEYERMHYIKRHKLSRVFEKEIFYTLIGLFPAPIKPAEKKRRLIIDVHRRRLLDYDRLVGGCVPLVDAIKHLGLIVDDRPKWLDSEYRQTLVKKGEAPFVIIEIREDAA